MTPLPAGSAKTALVREMFERIAPRYDRMNRLVSLGLDQRWRRASIAAIGVGPGDLVVDLACGTGDLAELAVRAGARVVALDSARAMLRGARARGVGASLGLTDASSLPLRSGCASAVTCGFALRNFADLRAVLGECARVLAPGGLLLLLEVHEPRWKWLRAAHGLHLRFLVPRLGAWLSDSSAYRYLPAKGELERLLVAVGFAAVARTPFCFGAAQLFTAMRT